jgi:hypothetical protein
MSGSTRYRVSEIQEAALAFVEQLRDQDRVMVIAFDSVVRVCSEFTNDRKRSRARFSELEPGQYSRLRCPLIWY